MDQIVTEIGLICQIIFCPILFTEFLVKFNGKLGILVFDFKKKDPS